MLNGRAARSNQAPRRLSGSARQASTKPNATATIVPADRMLELARVRHAVAASRKVASLWASRNLMPISARPSPWRSRCAGRRRPG